MLAGVFASRQTGISETPVGLGTRVWSDVAVLLLFPWVFREANDWTQ